MVYAIIKVVNGNYSVHAEGFTDLTAAKVSFHGLCQVLWNAADVYTGCVSIVDENMEVVYGNNMTKYQEFIYHDMPEPETEEPEGE